jgi:hypothetical protein
VAKKKRKPQKTWVWAPVAQPVPDDQKTELERKAAELVEMELKPRYVKPPPNDERWNYVEDIYTKWHQGRFFYFCACYRSPGPDALSPTFEACFARMEHMGRGRFRLAYMRHTGQWWTIYDDLTADECLEMVREGGHFGP